MSLDYEPAKVKVVIRGSQSQQAVATTLLSAGTRRCACRGRSRALIAFPLFSYSRGDPVRLGSALLDRLDGVHGVHVLTVQICFEVDSPLNSATERGAQLTLQFCTRNLSTIKKEPAGRRYHNFQRVFPRPRLRSPRGIPGPTYWQTGAGPRSPNKRHQPEYRPYGNPEQSYMRWLA